ncbi:GTP-binding protein [Chitinimonas arctica]|uniref:GTP-binding protein n=1 Tax=Chitinimonas arctica TaxID=2594795 RepID=A0A516SFG6_9NEIS|nr:GTP-binding protein [Chitinimonas arctica]QDQ26882.1 GTP-binding protein [Chitinimonas arctica]
MKDQQAMAEKPTRQPVPVNLITGFLGVGKTTAIRRLLANKPADEYWAVLVNEFGEVGIDGAALSEASDTLNVVEVPGGCICCTTSPMLRVSLTRLLQSRRPDRLIIEPSGLGHPAGIIDVLRDPFLAAVLDLRATITLVDPRHLDDSRYTSHEIWRDQLSLADVLVANKCDRADAAQIDRFQALAAAMFPPKLAVTTGCQGEFDPALLDATSNGVGMTSKYVARVPPSLSARSGTRTRMPTALHAGPTVQYRDNHGDGQTSRGWLWDASQRFSAERLATLFQSLHDHTAFGLPAVQRAKGVFHTDHGWLLFNWVAGEASASEIAWRRDCRAELIVASRQADWATFEAALFATREDGESA